MLGSRVGRRSSPLHRRGLYRRGRLNKPFQSTGGTPSNPEAFTEPQQTSAGWFPIAAMEELP